MWTGPKQKMISRKLYKMSLDPEKNNKDHLVKSEEKIMVSVVGWIKQNFMLIWKKSWKFNWNSPLFSENAWFEFDTSVYNVDLQYSQFLDAHKFGIVSKLSKIGCNSVKLKNVKHEVDKLNSSDSGRICGYQIRSSFKIPKTELIQNMKQVKTWSHEKTQRKKYGV